MSLATIFADQLDPMRTVALLTGGVGPRPIALASTRSPEGVRNLAPFSFFNAFGSHPPMIAFAPNRRGRDGTVKHTWSNAVATREFVIAAVTWAMAEQMNLASAEYGEGVDEFPKSGLTPVPARLVKPDLVAESPFQLECRLHQALELGSGPGCGQLLVGQVLAFHVRDDCWEGDTLDPGKLDLVGRNGGSWYTRAWGQALFRLPKPAGLPMGVDALPEAIRTSPVLTGSDLARLAGVAEAPDLERLDRRPGDPADMVGLERAMQAALRAGAVAEAWRLAALRLSL
jgi:flavin reductase (DIM6/NTAB) family NADH-FMN oxidoreductase RutF